MRLKFSFETPWPGSDNMQTNLLTNYYRQIKALRPDIECIEVNSVEERMKPDSNYHGSVCKYNAYSLLIENPDNGKYIVVSYAENHYYMFKDPAYFNWDLSLMQDFITAAGIVNNSIDCRDDGIVKYTPGSYCTQSLTIEDAIEKHYALNINKVNPLRPKFTGHCADPVRKFVRQDERYEAYTKDEKFLLPYDFIGELNSSKINVSLTGNAEICHRDIEIMGLGNVCLRPKLKVKFHNPLIPDYHYIGVDYKNHADPKEITDLLINKYYEIKDNTELQTFIGNNAREWYLKNGTMQANIDILIKIVDFNKLA